MIALERESTGGLLLDVEGTTTPISFVHSKLFPYVRRHFRAFLSARLEDPELRSDIARLESERDADEAGGKNPPEAAAEYLEWLMDQDRKSGALKSIQGRIWEAGYRDGDLRGEVFDDVLPAFERWSRAGLEIRIFSSGSILAQKLLFGNSTAGDLTQFISGYFDTTTGSKKEPDSYLKIAEAASTAPRRILFVSDSVDELAAASAAGFRVALSLRPGNAPLPPGHAVYDSVRSFDEIRVP